MQHIKVQSPAFVQPKGLLVSNKDAVMEKIDDIIVQKVSKVVSENAVELVESNVEDIGDKVGSMADKQLDKVEEKVADLLKTAEARIQEMEATKQIGALVDKLDDNPAIKKVLDTVGDSIVEQVDGRVFSCFCVGWGLSLKISRRHRQQSPSTHLVIDSKLPELPSLPVVVKESLPPKALVESQQTAPVEQTSASG